jgi:hypothetical protein
MIICWQIWENHASTYENRVELPVFEVSITNLGFSQLIKELEPVIY